MVSSTLCLDSPNRGVLCYTHPTPRHVTGRWYSGGYKIIKYRDMEDKDKVVEDFYSGLENLWELNDEQIKEYIRSFLTTYSPQILNDTNNFNQDIG